MVLDERMASPRLESFNQRVAARCYLQSMSRDETCGYIRAQIHAVGGQPDRVFTGEALQAVHRATDGIPRLVNQVCDHVLLMAAIGRRSPVDAAGWRKPGPISSNSPRPGRATRPGLPVPSDILEFGQLDDDTCGELDNGATLADPRESGSRTCEPVAHAVARLNQIETGITALADEDAGRDASSANDREDRQFRPHLCREPEIELVFHHAHNPFSERFEQEEVIVDPLASLETLSGAAHRAAARDVESSSDVRARCRPSRRTRRRRIRTRVAWDLIRSFPIWPTRPSRPRCRVPARRTMPCRATIAICWRSLRTGRKCPTTMPWHWPPTARDDESTDSYSRRSAVARRGGRRLVTPLVRSTIGEELNMSHMAPISTRSTRTMSPSDLPLAPDVPVPISSAGTTYEMCLAVEHDEPRLAAPVPPTAGCDRRRTADGPGGHDPVRGGRVQQSRGRCRRSSGQANDNELSQRGDPGRRGCGPAGAVAAVRRRDRKRTGRCLAGSYAGGTVRRLTAVPRLAFLAFGESLVWRRAVAPEAVRDVVARMETQLPLHRHCGRRRTDAISPVCWPATATPRISSRSWARPRSNRPGNWPANSRPRAPDCWAAWPRACGAEGPLVPLFSASFPIGHRPPRFRRAFGELYLRGVPDSRGIEAGVRRRYGQLLGDGWRGLHWIAHCGSPGRARRSGANPGQLEHGQLRQLRAHQGRRGVRAGRRRGRRGGPPGAPGRGEHLSSGRAGLGPAQCRASLRHESGVRHGHRHDPGPSAPRQHSPRGLCRLEQRVRGSTELLQTRIRSAPAAVPLCGRQAGRRNVLPGVLPYLRPPDRDHPLLQCVWPAAGSRQPVLGRDSAVHHRHPCQAVVRSFTAMAGSPGISPTSRTSCTETCWRWTRHRARLPVAASMSPTGSRQPCWS